MLSENSDSWTPLLIEEFDENVDLTLGSPGPLVHTLEKGDMNKLFNYFLASKTRKPTGVAVLMASRIFRTLNEEKEFWLQKIKEVLIHPETTVLARVGNYFRQNYDY